MTAFVLVALGLLGGPGGGCDGVGDGEGGVNAPCTRDKDCRDGLSCTEGVCTGPDAGLGDAGPGAAADAAIEGGR